MLEDVQAWGGEIVYANRAAFADTESWERIAMGQQMLFIPMGGDGAPGIEGVKAYFDQLAGEYFDDVWCAAGTGTTIAGIARSSIKALKLVACIPGLKDPQLEQELMTLESTFNRKIILKSLPGDRFNQLSEEVIDGMNKWWQMTGIPTDRIYTGKMITLFLNHLQDTQHEPPKKVLLVHTGGLQGNRSLPPGVVKFVGA
jgi:1-aminocyclopropane-1-carboxylate deaminase